MLANVPGDLSHLKDRDFVGVTSVKQADGTERAVRIGILPEELRGVGEGSYMMSQAAGATPSRIQKITVPPDTPVQQYQLTANKPAAGDQVFLWAHKAPDGSLPASKGLLAGR